MTDLEMARLCADAMGVIVVERAVGPQRGQSPGLQIINIWQRPIAWYDPLHDDSQAMALVMDFEISIFAPSPSDARWKAIKMQHKGKEPPAAQNGYLNRAIVECVAKMQKSKSA